MSYGFHKGRKGFYTECEAEHRPGYGVEFCPKFTAGVEADVRAIAQLGGGEILSHGKLKKVSDIDSNTGTFTIDGGKGRVAVYSTKSGKPVSWREREETNVEERIKEEAPFIAPEPEVIEIYSRQHDKNELAQWVRSFNGGVVGGLNLKQLPIKWAQYYAEITTRAKSHYNIPDKDFRQFRHAAAFYMLAKRMKPADALHAANEKYVENLRNKVQWQEPDPVELTPDDEVVQMRVSDVAKLKGEESTDQTFEYITVAEIGKLAKNVKTSADAKEVISKFLNDDRDETLGVRQAFFMNSARVREQYWNEFSTGQREETLEALANRFGMDRGQYVQTMIESRKVKGSPRHVFGIVNGLNYSKNPVNEIHHYLRQIDRPMGMKISSKFEIEALSAYIMKYGEDGFFKGKKNSEPSEHFLKFWDIYSHSGMSIKAAFDQAGSPFTPEELAKRYRSHGNKKDTSAIII